jgi:predicted permease
MWIEDVGRDLQYAKRTLLRSPGFTLAAVLTLGIAVGGATAVFSLFDAVLLRPLPFPAAERLVLLYEENSRAGFARDAVRPRTYAAWAGENEVLDSVAAVAGYSSVLTWRGQPERITTRRVTASFFQVLHSEPALGRVFRGDEDRPGGERVVIISHGFWQRRFAGDSAVIGQQLILDDVPHLIVGVMGREFQFLESYLSAWVPAAFTPIELAQGGRYLTVVARMKADVDHVRVAANLDAIGANQARLHPADERWRTLRSLVWPLSERLSGDVRRPFAVLVAAVGVVLLIACANLAGLLLARNASRRQELAVRGALGASRARVVRQLLTESMALTAMGLVLGLVLARWTFAFLEQLVPASMTLFARPELDGRTLVSAALVAVATLMLFGLVPALRTDVGDRGEALKSGGRATRGDRGRRALVVAQVAMTLVLLVATGLLLQTFYQIRYANLGLLPERVLTLRTVLPLARYADHARRAEFYDRVVDRLAREPGVESAGFTTSVPLEWRGATSVIAIEGQPRQAGLAYDANHRQISTGYLQTIGVPLRHGRFFRDGDDERAGLVVIVNETLARQYWAGENPLGRRIAIDPGESPQWRTVVGVAGDVRQMGLDVPARAEIYIPYRQIATQPWFSPRDLVVRTAGDPTLAVDAITRAIHASDPALAISNIRPLDQVLDEEVASRRTGTTLLISFAAFALILSVVGLYGLIAYFVVQHVPEMGVRIALGAQPGDILVFVIARGMSLALAGVAVGILAALALPRLMASLLYGVTGSGGALLCLAATVLLLALSLVASYLPARRATRLDPVTVLRSQ